ncbi:hypothetical protein CSKR_108671, partial [Clonorchis sinensis]
MSDGIESKETKRVHVSIKVCHILRHGVTVILRQLFYEYTRFIGLQTEDRFLAFKTSVTPKSNIEILAVLTLEAVINDAYIGALGVRRKYANLSRWMHVYLISSCKESRGLYKRREDSTIWPQFLEKIPSSCRSKNPIKTSIEHVFKTEFCLQKLKKTKKVDRQCVRISRSPDVVRDYIILRHINFAKFQSNEFPIRFLTDCRLVVDYAVTDFGCTLRMSWALYTFASQSVAEGCLGLVVYSDSWAEDAAVFSQAISIHFRSEFDMTAYLYNYLSQRYLDICKMLRIA